jgi:segregation and condensation protein A
LALAEERDRLLSRLLACLTFKDVGAVLGHRLETNERFLPRGAGLDRDVDPAPPALRLSIAPEKLARLAAAAIARSQQEPDLDHLELDLPSVNDAIYDVRRRVSGLLETDFDTLTEHCERPIEVAAYFLAILELARWGVISVNQIAPDDPIEVTARDDAPSEFESEWAEA